MSSDKPSIALRITWTSAWLTAAETKVLLALASAGDWETGKTCYPKWETLVARAGLSRATVARTLARLENPRRPGGPLIVATSRRHRHSTTYDICPDQLATGPPKEQQVSLSPLLASPEFESHDETQTRSESQIETLDSEFESQFETPTGTPDLDQERTYTHTPRAREDAPPDPELALLGQPPPPRCAHPHRHAWCEGRIHVPRDLHFELLDRLGAKPGETRSEKAGRLIAFYAADQATLPATTSVPDAYAYWKAQFGAWVEPATATAPRERPFTAREIDEAKRLRTNVYNGCPHDPRCTDGYGACVGRIAQHLRARVG